MNIHRCTVEALREVAANTFVLRVFSPPLAREIQPGQFLNIKISAGTDPLLRRPFSVYRVEGDRVEIVFNVVGRGTSVLWKKRPGDILDVLGPLGTPVSVADPGFDTALLVGGGLGVAPLPLLTAALRRAGKTVRTFLGARTSAHVVREFLENVLVATDDGSEGLHGTVVDLLDRTLDLEPGTRRKIFGCGPTAMLHALAESARRREIPCEVSLEGPMACGIGICQGCPVELADGEKKYALMCTDGPMFDIRKIRI
jgi:dihydroorotate dehydrogenase electron transfer subunit